MSRARLLAARASPVAVAVAQASPVAVVLARAAAKVAAACATVGVVAETVTAIAGNVTEAAQKVRRAAESVGTAVLETEQAVRAVVAVLVLVVIVCTDIYLWVAWVASRLADRVVSLSSPTAHSIPRHTAIRELAVRAENQGHSVQHAQAMRRTNSVGSTEHRGR